VQFELPAVLEVVDDVGSALAGSQCLRMRREDLAVREDAAFERLGCFSSVPSIVTRTGTRRARRRSLAA
jgi:hypothetical protein